jgi:DNA-3-methyladenine glycosylase
VTQIVRDSMAALLSEREVRSLRPLAREFYQRDTTRVARELLGMLIVRETGAALAAARITEVEAYLGVDDPAAHTYRGRRTARVEVMWGEAGRLYVYFTYGMHHCANVVTRAVGVPEAVLLRAALAVHGAGEVVRRRGGRGGPRMLSGPARLCQGLAIDRALNGADLTAGGAVWLADDGFRPPPDAVAALPRVGVAYAGEAAAWPLRFVVAPALPPASPGASRRGRAAVARRAPARGRPRTAG